MRKTWLAALLAALALLSGCHNGGHAQNSTDMRSVNAVGDSEPLDVVAVIAEAPLSVVADRDGKDRNGQEGDCRVH